MTPVTERPRPAYPAIDVHTHLGRWLSPAWAAPDVTALLDVLDAANVERVVNLDGRWGEELTANVERYDRAHPGRFTTYCHVDWSLLRAGAPASALVGQLEDSVRRGARGVKVWKDLGLRLRTATGARLRTCDEDVVTVLRRAGELGLPVLIHTADPPAFFDPMDGDNERIEELTRHPHWRVADARRYPTFATLLGEFDQLLSAAPQTQFIGAHVGAHAEDLADVSARLEAHPNIVVDIAGRLSELGRQPRAFARLVARHPDRVLFGTDSHGADPDTLGRYFRFLETDDENFAYSRSEPPPAGRWRIAGADLPDAFLRAIYRDNALRLGL